MTALDTIMRRIFRDRLSEALISYSDGSTMLRTEDFDRIYEEEMGR